MWEYTDEVMDHYRNPRNVGSIENADAVGEAGSLACGDALKLYLKIDEKGIIKDAKFQTFGCGSAVASSSILTEMIIGKTVEEAKKITNKEIADKLGGLPPEKMHCSVMGHEALESALANYFGEEVATENQEKIVCTCFQVTENQIISAIKENQLTTVEEVTNFTKAGGACGKCKPQIQALLEKENKQPPQEKIDKCDITKLTKTQLILKINSVIENYISQELRKDGGDIELVDVDGCTVYVALKGSCKSCKNSQLTLKNFVESSLKEHVCSGIEVISV